jgi:hypothetical protein
MYKEIPVSSLVVGDWMPYGAKVGKRSIVKPKQTGVSSEQLAELRRLANQGKIRKVIVKHGVPFVPNFLMAYATAVLWGNLLFMILGF